MNVATSSEDNGEAVPQERSQRRICGDGRGPKEMQGNGTPAKENPFRGIKDWNRQADEARRFFDAVEGPLF